MAVPSLPSHENTITIALKSKWKHAGLHVYRLLVYLRSPLHVTSLLLFGCVCGSDQDQYQDQFTLESDMGHF